MNRHFKDYYWEKGSPKGKEPVEPGSELKSIKIVTDPYRKHISIEEYVGTIFSRLIYDSRLLDFRRLNPVHQMAWQKETIEEKEDQVICLIRNLEDRLIYREIYRFQDNLCRECKTYSPHNLLLSIQTMHYSHFNDPFNGIVLYDNNEHPVMSKRYAVDQENQFTELLNEEWALQKK